MIKLFAIDLDGTLLNSQKQLSEGNLKALHYAESKGAKIVICTGRPFLAMHHLIDQIGLNKPEDYIIVFNGAQVRRAKDGEVLVSNSMSYDDVLVWYNELNRLALPLNVIDDEWVYEPPFYPEGHPSFYVSKVTQAPAKTVDFMSFDADHRFNKMVVTIDEDYLKTQMEQLDPKLIEGYTLARSHPFQLEIMKKDVSKGAALHQLAEILNLTPGEIVVIGDEENDRSMLDNDFNSVVMANGTPEMKVYADYITGSNDDDGVAQAIYHYLDNKE